MSYVEQTWTTGDTITAEKLNHMESGIGSASAGDSGDGSGSPRNIALYITIDSEDVITGMQYSTVEPHSFLQENTLTLDELGERVLDVRYLIVDKPGENLCDGPCVLNSSIGSLTVFTVFNSQIVNIAAGLKVLHVTNVEIIRTTGAVTIKSMEFTGS